MYSLGSREPCTSHALEVRRRDHDFRQLFRARKAGASSDGCWKNSGSSPNSSHSCSRLILYSWPKPPWDLYPSKQGCHLVSRGLCWRWGSGGEGTVHIWLEVPAWVLPSCCLGGIAFRSSSLKHSPIDGFSELVHLPPLPPPPIQLSVDPIQAGCGPFLSVNSLLKGKLVLHFYWQVILILIFFFTYTCNQNVLL